MTSLRIKLKIRYLNRFYVGLFLVRVERVVAVSHVRIEFTNYILVYWNIWIKFSFHNFLTKLSSTYQNQLTIFKE